MLIDASHVRADRARAVPLTTSMTDRVILVLRRLADVTDAPRLALPDGRLRLSVTRRPSGAVIVGVAQSGTFGSDRDAIEAAESSLRRAGLRVRPRHPQKHVRGAHDELIVLPAVRGS